MGKYLTLFSNISRKIRSFHKEHKSRKDTIANDRLIFFSDIRRLIRGVWIDRRSIKSGNIYHHHSFQIVVSKKELMIQLRDCDIHDNLMKLLIYGRDLSDFETRIVRASLKFEFIGDLTYPADDFNFDKPHPKIYMKELFQGRYETIEEVKERIEAITGEPVSDEFAKRIFRKLVFIINTCCLVMADPSEIWQEITYRCFIEYAIDNDNFDFPDKCSIVKLFPKIRQCGCLRNLALENMPQDFVNKVCHEIYYDHDYEPLRL